MNAIRNWFTPATREAVYAAIASIAPILVAAGVLVPAQVEPILVIVAAVLQGFAGLLALANLKPTEAARWFGTVGRGVLYGGATTVATALVALGVITGDWSAQALTYVSLGLTAAAAILAVVTPKEVKFGVAEIPVVAKAIITPNNAVVSPEVEVSASPVAADTEPVQIAPPIVLENDITSTSEEVPEVPVEPDTDGRGWS